MGAFAESTIGAATWYHKSNDQNNQKLNGSSDVGKS